METIYTIAKLPDLAMLAKQPFFYRGDVKKQLLYGGLLFVAYLVAAQGGHLFNTQANPAIFWPPAGIALAALILGGYGLAPAILAASLLNSYLVGTPFSIAIVIAVANTLQALFGAYLLRKLRFNPAFARLHDTVAFLLTTMLASLVVPILGTLAYDFVQSHANLPFGSWWIGEMVSVLVLTPFIVRWLPRPLFKRTTAEYIEAAEALLLLVVIGYFLFWTSHTIIDGFPIVYLILVPFIWIALRLGPRVMTLAIFLTALIAFTGIIYGNEVPTAVSLGARFLSLEIFLGIITALFLLFVSLSEERRQTINSLTKHVTLLERALRKISLEEREKNDFLAVLAHELRNPLAPLMSSLELMRLKGGDTEHGASLDMMSGRVRTMARLLDDLLDISRVSHNKLAIQKEHIDLRDVVKKSVEATESVIKARDHTFSYTVASEKLMVDADPMRIEQIVVNLLTNAAKYTERGGQIRLALLRKGDRAILTVNDTGVGITPQMLPRVFDPFIQGEPAKRVGGGLGIGLALTRNLVETHGGAIEVLSKGAGLGSTFTVSLPLIITNEPIPAAKEGWRSRIQKFMGPSENVFRILVVDDNEAAANSLGELLTYTGHTVELAYDGESALVKAPVFAPNVVILDIGLPDMEGYEVASKLRMHGTPYVLIALTGYGQDEDKEKARKAGFDYHLTKPVGLADLETIFRELKRP